MKTSVNAAILATTKMDSGALGPLAMVAHQMTKPGPYVGTVFLGKERIGGFYLEVTDGGDRMQADLDLARYGNTGSVAERPTIRLKVRTEGYLLVYVSQGQSGYRVTLEHAEGKKNPDKVAKPVFDSSDLAEGDIFATTMVRPGQWAVEGGKEASARITVTYPKQGKEPYRPKEQGNAVEVQGGYLSPDNLTVGPGEGVVFRIGKEASARIRLSLVDPDDGPGKEPPKKRTPRKGGKDTAQRKVLRRARWENPRHRK